MCAYIHTCIYVCACLCVRVYLYIYIYAYIHISRSGLLGDWMLVQRRAGQQEVDWVCVCSVWVPCVALPSGGGSSMGPSLCVGPLFGSPVRVLCVGLLCGSPLCGSPVWVPCVGPSSRGVPCGIYSRDASRSCSRSRIEDWVNPIWEVVGAATRWA